MKEVSILIIGILVAVFQLSIDVLPDSNSRAKVGPVSKPIYELQGRMDAILNKPAPQNYLRIGNGKTNLKPAQAKRTVKTY